MFSPEFPRRLLLVGCALASGLGHALPQGGTVVSGHAHLAHEAATLTITQTTPTLLLDWQRFDIAAQETVTLRQPSRQAVALIRIGDAAPAQLRGRLRANGQVWLVNRRGLVFAAGSAVQAGGFLASTLRPGAPALAGAEQRMQRFTGTGMATVVNAGRIEVAEGGYAVLLGAHVTNTGALVAPQGRAAVVAGDAALLAFDGPALADLQLAADTQPHRADNRGLLQADGGHVLLQAGADDSAFASSVRNSGRLQARSGGQAGEIAVRAGLRAGQADLDGVFDASAGAGGKGGRVDTNAARLRLADSVRVTTAGGAQYGTWRIDPQDYTVAASGGDISGATLSANLATTSVTIESSAGKAAGSGSINVNDAVSWSANTTLTLTAANNVNINANLTATGASAGLVLNPNTANGQDGASGNGRYLLAPGAAITLSGATPALSIAGTRYTVINALGAAADATTAPATPTLQGMAALANLGNNYALGSDIDASATSTWNGGAGFTPAGVHQDTNPFTGSFDGLGHAIRNLTVNQPGLVFTGLFGFIGGNISNVGLAGGSVSGGHIVGMLAGCVGGNIANSHATGTVTGGGQVGGLAGCSMGSITNSYATGNVSGGYWVGGLVGSGGSVTNSRASGNVIASYKVAGGLVGMGNGTITGSVATGTVSSPHAAGGLAGYNLGGINASYATGAVSGGRHLGGLAGYSSNFIQASYASGNVTGSGDRVGGLVGENGASVGSSYPAGSIANSYALGNVSSTGCYVGGLAGLSYGSVSTSYIAGSVVGGTGSQCTNGALVALNGNGGTVNNAYWNSAKTGSLPPVGYGTASVGSAGLTAAQMRTAKSFAGFTFSATPGAGNAWVLVDADGSLNNAGGAAGVTLPLLAGEYATTITNAHQLQLVAMAPAAQYRLAGDVDATATATGNDTWSGAGFVPLPAFAGLFDGGGRRISGLTVKSPQSANVGLFATTTSAGIVRNLRLANLVVVAAKASDVGGLVGMHNGSISNSCVSGSVTGGRRVGGLVGNSKGGIGTSCMLGSVKGDDTVGGLAGVQMGGLSQSYATASVSGSSVTGGLVGYHSTNRDLSDSYATGAVNGGYQSGGLVGENDGRISRSYSVGPVQGYQGVGGLVGAGASFPVSNSFWDTTTSRRQGSTGGRGMNTADMQTPANFTSATPANGNANPGWDGANVWVLRAGSYPQLRNVSPAP